MLFRYDEVHALLGACADNARLGQDQVQSDRTATLALDDMNLVDEFAAVLVEAVVVGRSVLVLGN